MKNIVFFLNAGISKAGGAERVLCYIANTLDNLGYSISILAYHQKEKPYYDLNKSVKLLTLDYAIPDNLFKHFVSLFFLLKKCRLVNKLNKTDTLIALGVESSILVASSMLFNSKVKKISWIHYSFFQKQGFRGKLFLNIFAYAFDSIIVLNKTDLTRYKKIFKDKVIIIPNPVPFKSETVSSLDNKTVLAIGRIDKVKGFDYLINAFKLVVYEYGHKDWILEIYGNNNGERENLENLKVKLKLTNNVFFFDAISNISDKYISSDIFLMSSRNEAFPMVLLEAKEHGLPIISFDCDSGPRDIIIDGVDGILVKPFDVSSFAESISLLIADTKLRHSMGKTGKENNKKFYIENIVEKWENIL